MSKHTSDPSIYNNSNNSPLTSVIEKEMSRRRILKGGATMAAFGFLSTLGLTGCSNNDNNTDDSTTVPSGVELGFATIAGAKLDSVSVPQGYSAQVLAPWGTPLSNSASEWLSDGSNTSEDQLHSTGMHHDGMQFFPLDGSSTEGLLCINHEYIDATHLHPSGPTSDQGARPAEEARKEINAHGVSVVHIQLNAGSWDVVTGSRYNRRFTAGTEMNVAGPVADSDLQLLKTKYTVEKGNHKLARGTNNNCGNGHTPWGTYLTCEENWPGYFVNTAAQDEGQTRIGISDDGTRYSWETVNSADETETGEFARFNVTPTGNNADEDFRNEANGHGYIVEIDPYNPDSIATKRTALGRFRHEDCSFGKLTEGQPVVFYSGHDGRFEYLYKFVSSKLWNPTDSNRTDRITVGSEYMDQGTLYVARFDEQGQGVWIPLLESTITTTGQTLGERVGTLAEIIMNCPLAGDLVGATPMDRPEWTTVDPNTGTVYVSLTNNTRRTEPNAANPRVDNQYGHIIRWDEGSIATEFSWDFFLFGSDVTEDASTNLSGLSAGNALGSPDGLSFDPRGILWVQTDGGGIESTNDQMLAVVPSRIADPDSGTPAINSSNQNELRRFFVGANGSEVTGIAFTPDQKSFFINVQHPDNWPYSATDATVETPSGTLIRPRSSTVVITKDDGGAVGV